MTVITQKVTTLCSCEKNINLKAILPSNCSIALNDITYINNGFNIKKDSFIKFKLVVITKKINKTYLPEIIIPIKKGFYGSFYQLKSVITYCVRKAASSNTEDWHFYQHALQRLVEKNNHFYIAPNESKKRYHFDLNFGEEIRNFLNLDSSYIEMTNSDYMSSHAIKYVTADKFSFNCLNIDPTPISGLELRFVSINESLIGSKKQIEFENLEFKKLKKKQFNFLEFDWPSEINVVYYTIMLKINK